MTTVDPSAPRPAWSRESVLLQLDGVETLEQITPEWAWGGANGEGVRVAVIDSGIDHDHPDLEGCVDADAGVIVEVGEDGDVTITPGVHDDVYGHGTACAGIIHSLAPAARITSVRVLGPALRSTSDVFLAGLSWAVEQGFDVVNLSLGARKRDAALAFHELCDRAYFNGQFLVTAANNINKVTYPSLFASVTSVACNMTKDPYRFHHNPEPPTEFLARGIEVEVPWQRHERITTTGNSFAAPHIAGIATKILSKHPGLRPFQLKTILWATSANVREAGEREMAGRLTRVMQAAGTGAGPSSARTTMAMRALRPSSG